MRKTRQIFLSKPQFNWVKKREKESYNTSDDSSTDDE